jgi:hypothetical protein
MEELAKAPRFLGLSENDRQAVTSAKLLYEKERRVNSDEFRRLVGQPIIYGQQVQLKHVATGLLLTVKKTASEVERGALKVVLSSGHQGSWFSVASGPNQSETKFRGRGGVLKLLMLMKTFRLDQMCLIFRDLCPC